MPDDLTPWEQSDDIAGFGEALQGILGLFTLNGAALAGVAGVLTNQDMEQHRPSLVTVAELLELLRRGELSEERVRGELARLGYSSSRIDALLRLRPHLIDAGEAPGALPRQ